MKYLIKKIIPVRSWLYLCGMYWSITREIRRWISIVQVVGPSAAVTLLTGSMSSTAQEVRRLRLKGYRHPIYYRTRTSDLDVIRQVFVERQYASVGSEPDVKFIIDCGANIGCTSFYFLDRYPRARLISIEPDARNFAVCLRNLAPFGDRVKLINTGIWPAPVPLKTERGGFADGREWAVQVRPTADGEAHDLIATTMNNLIESSEFDKVDILKIDIEGSELALFSEGTERWLPKIRHIVIELHGPDCEQAFEESLSKYSYTRTVDGEILVCKGLRISIDSEIEDVE